MGASATLFDVGITNLGFLKLGILTPTNTTYKLDAIRESFQLCSV